MTFKFKLLAGGIFLIAATFILPIIGDDVTAAFITLPLGLISLIGGIGCPKGY